MKKYRVHYGNPHANTYVDVDDLFLADACEFGKFYIDHAQMDNYFRVEVIDSAGKPQEDDDFYGKERVLRREIIRDHDRD